MSLWGERYSFLSERVMAHQTLFLLRLQDCIMVIVLLAQCIEHGARLRIDSRNLDILAVIDPTDINIIIEVKRAGRIRCDLSELKAGLRKSQCLRGNRDVVVLQERGKIPPLFGVLELQLPGHVGSSPILPQRES